MSQPQNSTLLMDFFTIKNRFSRKENKIEVYPEFIVDPSDDLMVRGKNFYAFWNEDNKLWSQDRLAIRKKIDKAVIEKSNELKEREQEKKKKNEEYLVKFVEPLLLKDFSTGLWTKFLKYNESIKDNYTQLDTKLTFLDTKVEKKDYVSRRLPYSVVEGDCSAWEKLISTLYNPEERAKIEWAIGAILSGDSKTIQKFLVFYGEQGSGKSTILNIIMKLFEGYYVTFKAENLVRGTDQFNLDFLSSNPLVAIDADSKLDKIESNATMNKLVSHEQVQVNEKYKDRYPVKPICMLMLATNSAVRITNARSGIIRRLIDIEPSNRKIPEDEYFELMDQVNMELGAIAYHCKSVYKQMGKSYYSSYVPERMMYRTDPFFNFMDEQKDIIINRFPYGITGAELWAMWKDYCQQSGIDFIRKRYEIIDEAKSYFEDFKLNTSRNGVSVRSCFIGLKLEKFNHDNGESAAKKKEEDKKKEISIKKASEETYSFGWLNLNCTESLLDKELAECPAQYENSNSGAPRYKWEKVRTKLKDLDTSCTHYVKGPGKLIFVDFDKHGPDGKKDLKLNLEAAGSSRWKPTYSELSNSGCGIHNLYWYDGDVNDLSNMMDDDPEIEIKAFPDDQLRSMRRRLSRCNNLPIAHISSGLPLKEKKKVINWDGVKDEKHLRNIVINAIDRKVRPYGEEPKTITLVKYISDVLKDAQSSGINYDLRDLDNVLYSFAASSHNHKDECINLYYDMELRWPKEEPKSEISNDLYSETAPIIILDCEVTRNLLLVIYKELEPDGVPAINKKPDKRLKKCIRLYNPKPHEIAQLFEMKIVGHNAVGYDNHILYAAYLGYSPERIFEISQDIIINGNRSPFREAKNVSYTDTLDVASEKKGLKKVEIEMHIPHKEMEIDWSKPLPESEWERLAQYCENDVMATEAYFMSKRWQADFKARKILAALTGMTVNDSTNNLVAQLIFGDVREPWHEFVYPDLKKEFPPYRFENGKSYYYDELIGEGGRVYAEPGMYYNTVTFDVASMHPTSIIVENGFGPYTKVYKDLYEARIAIKHKDYEKARKLFNGRLAPYLENDDDADDLAYALKIALNSTYGMTAANFQNRFKDPHNVDNWVAKRGALFMEKLRLEVQKRGGHVIHIKTDSIKLVQPSEDLQNFVIQFGKDHGYTFEIESKYERICLVNHAVYIALRQKDDESWLKECKKAKKAAEENETPYYEPTRWTATGAQFAHPFVFKHLFSKEPLEFWDFCETKTVKTALYLDLNEKLKNVESFEKDKKKIQTRIRKLEKESLREDISDLDKEKINEELKDLPKDIDTLNKLISEGHNYIFVGKAGEFIPVKDGCGGGLLMRKESDGDYGYATGAKGYRWMESEYLQDNPNWKKYVDIRYFRGLTDTAIETIGEFGDFEMFAKGEEDVILPEDRLVEFDDKPWDLPCKTERYAFCSDCPDFISNENGYSCKQGYDIAKQILG